MAKIEKDTRVLAQFIDIYCQEKHKDMLKSVYQLSEKVQPILCRECTELIQYAAHRREVCPLDPKPTCKNCKIHCYRPEPRAKIREIMRFSGMNLIKRGRLDMLWHYFF